jgi:hypothetical protein
VSNFKRKMPALSELRDIGWTYWDPINLKNPDGTPPIGPIDEYDRYLLHVAGMLVNGETETSAIEYLVDVVQVRMDLGKADGEGARAATVVREIAKCVVRSA